MQGLGHPPLNAAYSAPLNDIVSFLNDEVDVQRVADLTLPLSFISYWHRSENHDAQSSRAPSELPAAYAVMKLTLLPDKFKCPEFGEDKEIRTEPRMLAMLRGRQGQRRLRCGVSPPDSVRAASCFGQSRHIERF